MSIEQLEDSFSGERLLRAVRNQQLVDRDAELAAALIEGGKRFGVTDGDWLYRTGDLCQGVFFILEGRIELLREGNPIANLDAGQQVGSWPMLYSDPRYDVDAKAVEDSVLWQVSIERFRVVGKQFPVLWENLARTQADRLKQMNDSLLPKNPRPRLLIGSSTEALPIARELGDLLTRECAIDVDLWKNIFPTGDSTLESLTTGLDDWDFAVLILSADDEVISRNLQTMAPRDNVLFEAGLCMGRMGRRRAMLARPRQPENLKIPTDLSGITLLEYADSAHDLVDEIVSRVAELGERVRVAIDRL